MPAFKIGKREAVGRRLKRNYIYLFVIILVAWSLKIFMDAPAPIRSLDSLYRAFGVQNLPAWLGCSIYGGTVLFVIFSFIYILRFSWAEVGELAGDETHRWRI
jgi:uncharacterized membrane protein